MGMYFVSTCHTCGYLNSLENKYGLIQFGRIQLTWDVETYQLRKLRGKTNKTSLLLCYLVQLHLIWLCFSNNKTCSGWSYPLDLNPQGKSGGGSAQPKWIFSSPGTSSGAKGKWMGWVAPMASSLSHRLTLTQLWELWACGLGQCEKNTVRANPKADTQSSSSHPITQWFPKANT